jgi:hypothetical protein
MTRKAWQVCSVINTNIRNRDKDGASWSSTAQSVLVTRSTTEPHKEFSPPQIHQVIPKHYPMEEEEKQIRY